MIFKIPTAVSEIFGRSSKAEAPKDGAVGKYDRAPELVTDEENASVFRGQMDAIDAREAKEKEMATESKWRNVLDHVKAFFGIAIKDIEVYTPEAADLATILFPQYKGAIEADKAVLLGATSLIKNTVLTIEQKYSEAAKSDTTNAAKLEDALALIVPVLVPTLNGLKVPVPATLETLANKVAATVAILKDYTVPVTDKVPSAQGT